MVCTTIQNKGFGEICELLDNLEMAEIRLDRCSLSLEEINYIFSSEIPLVATSRVAVSEAILAGNDRSPKSHRAVINICKEDLFEAVEAGASYVDVEDDAPKEMLVDVGGFARENGTVFIVSHHDFSGTPSYEELKAFTEECFRKGADVAKIVTMVRSSEDCARVLRLYEDFDPASLIAFCMGEAGRQTRVECLRLGAPYTYAALSEEDVAAPGQWPTAEIMKAVYGDRKFFGHPNLGPIPQFSSSEPASEQGSTNGFALEGTHPTRPASEQESGSEPASEKAVGFNSEPAQVSPVIRMPASKSFAQRAIIAAALAGGESHLHGYTPCLDNEAAIAVARKLGAEVVLTPTGINSQNVGIVPQTIGTNPSDGINLENTYNSEVYDITIRGISASPESLDIERLNVGESGLLARLMIPLSAILSTRDITIEGEGTLKTRPLKASDEIMSRFGIRLSSDTVPIKISGTFTEGRAEVSGKEGSQLISGLLMSCPLAQGSSVITVTEPKSIPYMFITLDVLREFGVEADCEMGGGGFTEEDGGWGKCSEITFKLKGGQKYKAADIDLEGDWSAAANFLVAGAVFGRAEIAGLDTSSLQADISIIDILGDAGVIPLQVDDETDYGSVGENDMSADAGYVCGDNAGDGNPAMKKAGDKGTLVIRRSPLTAFEVDLTDCPDLFPITAVLAAFCNGVSHIEGIDRLAHKESDRGTAIVEMLTQMGVKTQIERNALVIEGHSLAQRCLAGTLLKGGNYTSHHDHRMAMALKVASLGADGPITIDDEACVGKSFPAFNEIFQKLI